MIFETIEKVFLLGGLFFLLLAAIGINKFPDLYTRMAAGSKATTLGLLGLIVGAAFGPYSKGQEWTLGLAFFFVLLVAPVAAHLLGRAAYRAGARPWQKTLKDDWKGMS
jgi:multicomponent Na+:H+ antiporter subunit G